ASSRARRRRRWRRPRAGEPARATRWRCSSISTTGRTGSTSVGPYVWRSRPPRASNPGAVGSWAGASGSVWAPPRWGSIACAATCKACRCTSGSTSRRHEASRRHEGGTRMLIVDAQIHIWKGHKPTNPNHRQIADYTADDVLKEMDEGGVNAAVIHPPGWDPSSNALAVAAAQRQPPSRAILGNVLLQMIGQPAERHPGLKLIIDHFGRPDAAWTNLPELVAAAKHRNVALKATGAPSYSSEPYPHRDIHGHIRKLYDAFGPDR